MRILFFGSTECNAGPANVNKGVVSNLTDRFLYVTTPGKYREMVAMLWKLFQVDAVVVSGVGRKNCILVAVAKILGKRSVYLMHGCAEYEYKLDEIQPDKNGLAQEACLWRNADLILAVSERYMLWFRKQYPQYAHKTDYIYNGVDSRLFARKPCGARAPGSVAVSGGMTPLKNNMPVVRAVEALEGKANIRIYGGRKQPMPEPFRYAERMGKLRNEAFLDQLSRTSLFVLNSRLESFSIATMEALACGCSLLVSEAAGVCDLLALEETDVIHDPMDVEEIRQKIDYLLDHPNYDRLRSQFDPEDWSFAKMVENLEKKCGALLQSPVRK